MLITLLILEIGFSPTFPFITNVTVEVSPISTNIFRHNIHNILQFKQVVAINLIAFCIKVISEFIWLPKKCSDFFFKFFLNDLYDL